MPTNPTTITHNGERYVRLEAVLAVLNDEWAARWLEWIHVVKLGPERLLAKTDGQVTGAYGSLKAVKKEFEQPEEPGPTDADHDRETARLNRRDDAAAHNAGRR